MAGNEVPRVLVVDDEPEIRELLVDALAGSEFQVSVASSGDEAIDLAEHAPPDVVVADLLLGDCSGLDVIDRLRTRRRDLAAVVITGQRDAAVLAEASRCRPVELMTKPLDVDRLRRTIADELARQAADRRTRRRAKRLRRLARETNIERKSIHRSLDETCENLTSAYRTLCRQVSAQHVVISYQQKMLAARDDDDVFQTLFRVFVERSGPIFGVAMVCDADAELQIAGRFGVPYPDESPFCSALVRPIVGAVLGDPKCMMLDAGEESELFDESIRRYLPGVSILAVPLIPAEGELIGLIVLYRKGEQPFTDIDVALAEVLGPPTAIAVRRNE